VLVLRKVAAEKILATGAVALMLGVAVTLAGVRLQQLDVMLSGAVIAGVGFGALFSGVLRTILPLAGADERASLLSAYLVASYLAFSLPAIAAGVAAPVLGLATTAYAYGGVVIALAIVSLVASRPARRPRTVPARQCPESGAA
jgi:MFS family permease